MISEDIIEFIKQDMQYIKIDYKKDFNSGVLLHYKQPVISDDTFAVIAYIDKFEIIAINDQIIDKLVITI